MEESTLRDDLSEEEKELIEDLVKEISDRYRKHPIKFICLCITSIVIDTFRLVCWYIKKLFNKE